MVSRNDKPEVVAGVGTGNIFINVIAASVGFGFNGTLETFVSQSFGSNQKRACGVAFNRGRIIATILFVPIAILFFLSENILVALNQPAVISAIARDYILIALPGVYFMIQYDCRKRFL